MKMQLIASSYADESTSIVWVHPSKFDFIKGRLEKAEFLYEENEQLKAKLEKAKEALRFYANDVYWNKTSVGYYDRIDCSDTSLVIDSQVGGKRARAALKGE